jgi:hypothetical protein
MSLDFFGGMLLITAIVINLTAVLSALDVTQTVRLIFASIVGLWVGLQASLAAAGAFTSAFSLTFPLVGLMVATPLVATGVAAAVSPAVRSALMTLPLPLLVGLNAGRIFGAFFLLLAAAGRLAGPFPYSAGWGDVITGVAALPFAYMAVRQVPVRALHLWNLFGAADLFAAIALGTMSFNGSVLQLIETGVGSNTVAELPWVLIPTVLVPFYLVTHGIIFAQLRRETAEVSRTGGQAGF